MEISRLSETWASIDTSILSRNRTLWGASILGNDWILLKPRVLRKAQILAEIRVLSEAWELLEA
jgi:hypothetical protein